jgi:hypothetical protein
MILHTVTGTYVDGAGNPAVGRVVFSPIQRGVTTDAKIVLPLPVVAELTAGTVTAQLPGSGEDWWWTVIEPDGRTLYFELSGPLNLASLTVAAPPHVHIVVPASSGTPAAPTALPDTGWVDARPHILPPFTADTGERELCQLRRYGQIVFLRGNMRYAGDGSHPYGTHLACFAVPTGYREGGWHGGVGLGVANSRYFSVDIFHADDTLNLIDVSSTTSKWSASQHVTLTASWMTDDPHPNGG